MEEPSRKEWRKSLKKLQRKRRRQKVAKEREKKCEEEEAARLSDPVYIKWQHQQEELGQFQRLAEEQKKADEEEAWLRQELLAKRQFRLERQRLEAEQEAVRQQQHKAFEERESAQRKRREEHQHLVKTAAAEFELMMQRMQSYLECTSISAPPHELRQWTESRPGQKMCNFFQRTNCCRYGMSCQFNHRRPLLSKIIVVRHFYTQPLLKHSAHSEYATADAMLELSEQDLREDYDAFFNDVVPELESFGKMINFRTICNAHPHLNGHVFVEYTQERSALKAFIGLQGRYYAAKRLHVEFSNLSAWRGAICGLSLNRKCPKGQTCNYLHLFRNPQNKYNTLLEYTKSTSNAVNRTYNSRTPTPTSTPSLSWNDVSLNPERVESRNWRWSASPEVDLQRKPVLTNNKCGESECKCRHSRNKETKGASRVTQKRLSDREHKH